ncbi:serine hydrolase domain-containing protein [Rudaea cellulosilytica]|uniref:serine hydrolase domain-containing protein n=1 Tax=Rudaea cellulosilytica TaxID=540746 RepID=UPI001B7FCA17|nr:serine hydrolase domain-containing protein [Rudaea cellulosilytica]
MNLLNPFSAFTPRGPVVSALLALGAFLCPVPGITATAAVTLPDTPVGQLGAQLIHHINTDSPMQIQRWAPGALSASVPQDDKANFVANLGSAARDSGGIDLFDARTDPRQPGLLQMVIKARRTGQFGLFFITADPAKPSQLAQAHLVPMDDPALYADWPQKAVSHAELARLIHDKLDRLVRTEDFSGCVTVTDHAKTIFDECRGQADRRFAVPVDRQTTFHIGSIGKTFTAVAIAQLVEAGKLSWDTTLAQAAPEYPDHNAAKKITVWQLLHNTSGLSDIFVPEYFGNREHFIDPVDYLDLIARQPKVSEPGKEWNYSDAGFMLLGRIVENVSHEDYYSYIQRHVFAPAGMHASGFDRLDEITPKLSVGYYHDGMFSSTWKMDWSKIQLKGGPAGGGYSNNTDLLLFADALRNGRLVKAATLAKMFADEVPAGPGGEAAGFGDRLSHGSPVRGHAGGIEGTTANLQMVWNANAAVALTSNEGPLQTWMLAEHIADLLAAGSAKP